jgi:hypothetical protein
VTLWTDSWARARPGELASRVCIDDLTTLEALAVVAVMESADQSVNAPPAPALRLASKRRRRSARTGTRSL